MPSVSRAATAMSSPPAGKLATAAMRTPLSSRMLPASAMKRGQMQTAATGCGASVARLHSAATVVSVSLSLRLVRSSRRIARAATAFSDPVSSGIELLQESRQQPRSEEHTSELQSLMRISYAVFCLKKKKHQKYYTIHLSDKL